MAAERHDIVVAGEHAPQAARCWRCPMSVDVNSGQLPDAFTAIVEDTAVEGNKVAAR